MKTQWALTVAEEEYFNNYFMRQRRVKRDTGVKIIHYRETQRGDFTSTDLSSEILLDHLSHFTEFNLLQYRST